MREKLETLVQPVVAGLLALVTLIGLIGPAIKSPSPHDIPVGLVGPAPATQQIATAFATNAPGAFHFTTYGTETDARAAIDARDIDGALVLGSGGPHLIIAGAAGDGATGVITGVPAPRGMARPASSPAHSAACSSPRARRSLSRPCIPLPPATRTA